MLAINTNEIFNNLWEHALILASGATGLSIIAHAVNTCPTPKNPYGAWLLGVVQYAVGQRVAARNTLQGMDTLAVGVAKPPQVQDAEQQLSSQLADKADKERKES